MLQRDPTDTMVDILIFHTNNLANGTHTPYTPIEFQPTINAISVNCLLFASLGISICTAFASIMALQWVADYDAAIMRGGSSQLDRVKRRQFRFAGIQKWRMAEVIDTIPDLFYMSVGLFGTGTILWIAEINRMVSYIIAGWAVFTYLLYNLSMLLAVIFPSAPFRTPSSRVMYSVSHAAFRRLYKELQPSPFTVIAEWIKQMHPGITDNLEERDERVIHESPGLELDAYLWVCRRIDISQHSYARWIILLEELLNWTPERLQSLPIHDGPWMRNLTIIAQHYYNQSHKSQQHTQDPKHISVLVVISTIRDIHQQIEPAKYTYERDPSASNYWDQYCSNSASTLIHSPMHINPLFLLSRDLPIPSLQSTSEMEATMQLSRWRNSLDKKPDAWRDVMSNSDRYSPHFLQSAMHTLCQYILTGRWDPKDTSNKVVYSSLFTKVLQWAVNEKPSFDSTTLAVHAFRYLVECKDQGTFGTVTVTEEEDLFDGMNLHGHRVSGLVACLLWSPSCQRTPLKFPVVIHSDHIKYLCTVCMAIRARPQLMGTILVQLLADSIRDSDKAPEAAIILKFLHRESPSFAKELPLGLLGSMVGVLQHMVDSHCSQWLTITPETREYMIKEAKEVIHALLMHMGYGSVPLHQAVAWPQHSERQQPVGDRLSLNL